MKDILDYAVAGIKWLAIGGGAMNTPWHFRGCYGYFLTILGVKPNNIDLVSPFACLFFV